MLASLILPAGAVALQQAASEGLSLRIVTGNGDRQELAQSARSLLQAGGSTPELPAIAEAVLQVFAAAGQPFARIDSVRQVAGDPPAITVFVNAGPQIVWRKPGVTLPDSVRALVESRWIQELDSNADIPGFADNVLSAFGEVGYPLAQVRVDSVLSAQESSDSSRYQLVLAIDPGQRVVLDSVAITGNTTTRRHVILRNLRLRRGELFRESRIAAIPGRLQRLGYFKSVRPPQLVLDPAGNSVLMINVEEAAHNTFNGILGYNPPSGDLPGFLTGLFDVQLGNLFGTGRQLDARWERRGRETQGLAVGYREPWAFGIPLNLAVQFEQLFQDTLYVERGWQLTAAWPLLPNMELLARAERTELSPDSASAGRFQGNTSSSVGFGLRYDSRDYPLNPRTGAFYHTVFDNIRKQERSDSAGAFSQNRILVDGSFFLPVRGRQVLAIGVHWRQLTGARALNNFTDVFRFGGATSLRGYREEQFFGTRIAWANIELRYLVSRTSRAFVFFDQGYFFRREDDRRVQTFRRGWGFGARLDTGLGLIGLDYGFGEGDGLLDGKVHVSLVNRF